MVCSRSEFLVLCGTLVRETVQGGPLVLAEALLGLIDVDRNGRIDGAELRAVLGKLGIPSPLLLTIPDSVGIDYRTMLKDLNGGGVTLRAVGVELHPGPLPVPVRIITSRIFCRIF